MRRGSSLLVFLLFLAAGIAAGLALGWLVVPAPPAGDSPARLNQVDRELYIQLIADSFAANNDRDDARRRLGELGPGAQGVLVEMIARELKSEVVAPGVANLIALAAGLATDAPVVELLAQPQPIAPATLLNPLGQQAAEQPTTAPTDNRYDLMGQESLCQPGADMNLIEVNVTDSDGWPQPGVAVTVFWDGGRDSFYTGFVAGRDAGYADFTMAADIAYSVAVDADEATLNGLRVQLCPDGRAGGWRLDYRAREP